MKLNKFKKVILSFSVIFAIILGMGQTAIYAVTTGQRAAAIQYVRTLPSSVSGGVSENWGFQLYNGDSHSIYDIVELGVDTNGNPTTTKIDGDTRIYCLNATVGDTWDLGKVGTDGKVGTGVTYNTFYDFKKEKDDILKNVNTESNKVITSEYYSSIMWLLDNFYIPGKTNKDEFLARAGIVYGTCEEEELNGNKIEYNTYYYDKSINPNSVFSKTGDEDALYSNLYGNTYSIHEGYSYESTTGERVQVILPDELIESIQQAVIWYFTNFKDYNKDEKGNIFNQLTENTNRMTPELELKYIKGDEVTSFTDLTEYKIDGNDVGAMYREQAAILYNYLVDQANAHKDYTGEETTASISINCSRKAIAKQADGTYKVGPIKIETTGTVQDIALKVKDGEENDITTTCSNIPGNISENKEFYINVPSTTGGHVKLEVTANGNTTEQTLWTIIDKKNEEPKIEQPIVEINRNSGSLTATAEVEYEKEFDLKLLKYISAINGDTSKGKTITKIDTSKLATYKSTTADYTLSKDVITVQKGDYVTYTFRIYNECELDGYLTQISDNIPLGLQFVQAKGD